MEKLIACIIIIFALIFIDYIFYKMFSTLFVISGLSKEKARTQTLALLTLCGYSTKESELIVNYRLRRKIANACIIVGYIMSIVISGMVLGIIASLDFTQHTEQYLQRCLITLAISAGSVAILLLVTKIPFLKKVFFHLLEKAVFGRSISHNKTTIVFGDKSYERSFATIYLNVVPEVLKNKKISQINFHRINVSVLSVTMSDGTGTDNVDDIILESGMKIDVFGDAEAIKLLF